MTAFRKFYLWGMQAKSFMGLYFTAMVFLGGLLMALFGGEAIRLMTLLQMLLLALAIGFVQTLVLPEGVDFTRGIFFGRSLVWLLSSVAAVIVVSHVGGWFSGLPAWCPWLMGGFMLFGCGAILIGQKFTQEAETALLNEQLRHYQK